MPQITTTLGTLDLCFQCDKRAVAGTKLMSCSKCKIARYCSKECQRIAWKDHKLECRDHYEEMKEQHNPALTHLKSFMRWGDLWAWSFYGWAFIAGLEKYRKDKEFFKNHCFILRVQVGEATGKPIRKSQAFKAYKYHSSSFMTESEFKCAIHETIFSKDKETQSRYEDQVPRENNVVRIIILLESGHGLRMQLHQYLEAGFLAGFGPTSRAEGKALFDKLTDTTIAMLEDGSEQVIGTDVETRPKNFDGLDVDALAKRVGETYKERLKADMDVGNAAGFVDYIRMMQKEVTRETHMWLQVD